MNKKYKKNWIALVIGIGLWVLTGSILWAETENTKDNNLARHKGKCRKLFD